MMKVNAKVLQWFRSRDGLNAGLNTGDVDLHIYPGHQMVVQLMMKVKSYNFHRVMVRGCFIHWLGH